MPIGDELGLPQVPRKAIAAAVVVIAVVFVLGGALGTVGAGQRGVLLSFQAPTGEIKEEGLYYKIPFVEQVVLMSTQIQKYTAPASSSSKDLQVVTTEVTLNYQLNAASVTKIYTDLRQDYETRIIQPYIQEAVKSTTANYDAEELITQRPTVRDELENLVAERLKPLWDRSCATLHHRLSILASLPGIHRGEGKSGPTSPRGGERPEAGGV